MKMNIKSRFKAEVEKTIEDVMCLTVVEERMYSRKEKIELAVVSVGMLLCLLYAQIEYQMLEQDAKIGKFMYGMLALSVLWTFLYFFASVLYTKTKNRLFAVLQITLGYIGIVVSVYINLAKGVLEIFSKKINVYHVCKYFYIVVIAGLYTFIISLFSWKGLLWIEDCFREGFSKIDWYFGFWIVWYVIICTVFFVCLKVCCWLLKAGKEIEKNIRYEMQIFFYLFLLICIMWVWGKGAKGDVNETLLENGFINASTAVVLWGTIWDKMNKR